MLAMGAGARAWLGAVGVLEGAWPLTSIKVVGLARACGVAAEPPPPALCWRRIPEETWWNLSSRAFGWGFRPPSGRSVGAVAGAPQARGPGGGVAGVWGPYGVPGQPGTEAGNQMAWGQAPWWTSQRKLQWRPPWGGGQEAVTPQLAEEAGGRG